MTHEFLKWLATRWPTTSANGTLQWDRLRAAIKAPLSPEQETIWIATLVDLVADRWASLTPTGLATARAAAAFLTTEEAEASRQRAKGHPWWKAPMGVAAVEHYLRVAIDEIIRREKEIAGERAAREHPLDGTHRGINHTCDACHRHLDVIAACSDELASVTLVLVIRAYERALKVPR